MRRPAGDVWAWALVGIAACLTLLVIMASDHAATENRQARQVQHLERPEGAPQVKGV